MTDKTDFQKLKDKARKMGLKTNGSAAVLRARIAAGKRPKGYEKAWR